MEVPFLPAMRRYGSAIFTCNAQVWKFKCLHYPAVFLFAQQERVHISWTLIKEMCGFVLQTLVSFGIHYGRQSLFHCQVWVVVHQKYRKLLRHVQLHMFVYAHTLFSSLMAFSVPKKYWNVIPFMFCRFLTRVGRSMVLVSNFHNWTPTRSSAMGPNTMS